MVPTEMEDAHPTFRIFFRANSEKPMDFGEKKRIFRQTLQMDVNGSSTLQIWWFVFNTPIRCMGIWIELKHAQRWLYNVKYLFDSFLVYLSINNSAKFWGNMGFKHQRTRNEPSQIRGIPHEDQAPAASC